MHDVFISYSSKDRKTADAMCHYLENSHIKCWYAPRDIEGGQDWAEAIVEAIRASKVFVIIFSKNSNESVHVLNEISQAISAGCVVVPFRIDNTQMKPGVSYYLEPLHWLDAINPPLEKKLDNLCDIIKSVLGKELPAPAKKINHKKPIISIIAILVVVFALAVGGYAYFANHSGSTPETNQIEKETVGANDSSQQMEFFYISKSGTHQYPFYGTAMFSTDLEQYMVQNTETGKFSFVKTDTGNPVISDIDFHSDRYAACSLLAKENSKIMYFIDTYTNQIKIYDVYKQTWVNEKGIDLNLAETETIYQGLYERDNTASQKDNTDTMSIITYNSDKKFDCVHRLFNVKPDGSYKVFDISEYNLKESVSGIDHPTESELTLVIDNKNKLSVLDTENGTLLDISYDEMVQKYIPYLSSTAGNISQDKKYLMTQESTDGNTTVSVWNLQTGKEALTKTFVNGVSAQFASDNRLLCYRFESADLVSYDLTDGHSTQVLDSKYFNNKDLFTNAPYKFVYSEDLGLCFFCVCVYDEENQIYYDKLIASDTDGNIKYQSQPLYMPFESYYCDLQIKKDRIFYIAKKVQNGSVEDEFMEPDLYTAIYRVLYSIDKNGELTFSAN